MFGLRHLASPARETTDGWWTFALFAVAMAGGALIVFFMLLAL